MPLRRATTQASTNMRYHWYEGHVILKSESEPEFDPSLTLPEIGEGIVNSSTRPRFLPPFGGRLGGGEISAFETDISIVDRNDIIAVY